jgi:ABC-type phosphonate transport system ATPase subunit
LTRFSQPTPELPVEDVERAQEHYRDVLGFKIGWLYPGKEIGAVSRDDAAIFFRTRSRNSGRPERGDSPRDWTSAVAGDPAILLADEPTGNLDSQNNESVMRLLRELHQGGATICIVTHDARYAHQADGTSDLFDGRVVESGVAAAV